jgi:hypothetical protein
MLIITGPGRSGTSVIAQMYKELGFDPGGEWFEDVRAGLEDPEIVRLNEDILRALGAGRRARSAPPPLVSKTARGVIRFAMSATVAQDVLAHRRGFHGMKRGVLSPIHWDRVDAAVSVFGTRVRELASARSVVKDPRFSWTLGVWLLSGADIEHVLVCVRDPCSMARSRVEAGHIPSRWERAARDAFVYALGACLEAISARNVPYDMVRFPDFLDQPAALYRALRFPTPVGEDTFYECFQRVVRRDFVHQDG